jgi:hypothetical protein
VNGALSIQLTDGGRGVGDVLGDDSESVEVYV